MSAENLDPPCLLGELPRAPELARLPEAVSPRTVSKRRLALAGLQLATGLYAGSVVASHAACVETDLGPQPATICAEVDITDPLGGGTSADLGVIGGIALPDTHRGPLAVTITARPFNLKSRQVAALTAQPESALKLATAAGEGIKQDLAPAVQEALTRAGLLFLAANTAVWSAGPLYSWLKQKETGSLTELRGGICKGLVTSLGAVALAGGITAASFNPDALATAQLIGPLEKLETITGTVGELWENYQAYSTQMAEKTTYVYDLYQTGNNLEVIPDQNALKVLVISDIHCNVGIYPSLRQVAREAGVDVIINAGDDTDYGSRLEYACLDPMGTFKDKTGQPIPVLLVKGNHETFAAATYADSLPNVTVLQGEAVKHDGLAFIGDSDPRYSPDPLQDESADSPAMRELQQRLLRQASRQDAQVVVVHDSTSAQRVAERNDGSIGLVIGGHAHRRSDQIINQTNLHIEGSTGAGGIRVIEGEVPQPITFSILSLDKTSGRIVGGDLATIDAYGSAMTVSIAAIDPQYVQGKQPPTESSPEIAAGDARVPGG